MKRTLIVVADAVRARLFAYEEGADPAHELHEVRDLVSPGRKLRVGEPVPDDSRDAHAAETDAKFARDVVQALDEIITQDGARHVVVAASPKMLGEMRRHDGVLHRADLRVDEIPTILTTLTVAQLHDHLAAMDLIPPRRRLAAAR